MKTAIFSNISDKQFIGYWNGKGRTFESGESQPMPEYLARHFSKHLTNRILIELGKERSTSPKKPEDVPEFMDIFNKCFTPGEELEFSQEKDSIDVQIALAKSQQGKPTTMKETPEPQTKEEWKEASNILPDSTKPQVVLPPDFEEEE